MSYRILIKTSKISHEDWLKQRNLGIGGSDAGAIAGLNKYKSPFAIYMDKIGMGENFEQSESAYWGTTLEDIVAKEFQKRTGLKVRKLNAILQSIEYPFMLANLDRVITGPNGEKWGLECKTASEYLKDTWLADEMPPSYLLQIQHYLAVTGFEKFFVAVLIGGQTFTIKEILPDHELIEYLISIEKDFWYNNVEKQIPPAIDGSESSSEVLKKLYPESNEDSEVVLPISAIELVEKRNEVKDQIKELSTKCDEYENKLKSMLESSENGYLDKYKITWKTYETNRFDTKNFKQNEPQLYEKYIIKSNTRKFSIKEIKENKGDIL